MPSVTLDLLLVQLVTGIALGSIYVIVGLGLSLIFGMLHVVNFAHGAFFMVGGYVGVFLFGKTGNFWLSLILVPLLVGLMGMLVERVLIRPLYGRSPDDPLLLTFGLSWVFIEMIRIIFGLEGIPFGTPRDLRGAVDIGVGFVPLYRLFLVGLTAAILIGLWLFIEKTKYGLIIRAGARDPEIVRVLGVDVSRVWLGIFGMGTGIAGLAGFLSAPIQSVNPDMGVPVLAEAFVVTVVGGMGSLVGSIVAGLLVGVTVSMASLFMPEMARISIFALMALVLLVRPNGLFGRKGAMG